ncbi:hypothetical protein VTI28DRAFT_9590 [Corynascus sepedonium]
MTGTVNQVLTCYADDSGSSSLSRSLIPPSTLTHRVARRTAKQQRETARIPAVLLAESGKAPEHRAILPIWATPFIDSWRRCVSGGSPLKPLSLPLTGTPGPSHTLPFQPLIFPNPLLPRGRQAPGRPHPCLAVSTHDSCWRPLHARSRSLAWPTRRRLKCYGQPQGNLTGSRGRVENRNRPCSYGSSGSHGRIQVAGSLGTRLSTRFHFLFRSPLHAASEVRNAMPHCRKSWVWSLFAGKGVACAGPPGDLASSIHRAGLAFVVHWSDTSLPIPCSWTLRTMSSPALVELPRLRSLPPGHFSSGAPWLFYRASSFAC